MSYEQTTASDAAFYGISDDCEGVQVGIQIKRWLLFNPILCQIYRDSIDQAVDMLDKVANK